MLISVQERVKEIGTMKCLGALDRHITLLFLIEALLQGIIGGVIGYAVGVVAALLTTGFTTGFDIILRVPVAQNANPIRVQSRPRGRPRHRCDHLPSLQGL